MTRKDIDEYLAKHDFSRLGEPHVNLASQGLAFVDMDLDGNIYNHIWEEIIPWPQVVGGIGLDQISRRGKVEFNFISMIQELWKDYPEEVISNSIWYDEIMTAKKLSGKLNADNSCIDLAILPIEDFNKVPGVYIVTRDGEVWNKTTNTRLEPTTYGNSKVKAVGLPTKSGRFKSVPVDLIVGMAFVPYDPTDVDLTRIMHRDGDPKNTRADNLAWPTSENILKYASGTSFRNVEKGKEVRGPLRKMTDIGYSHFRIDIYGNIWSDYAQQYVQHTGTYDSPQIFIVNDSGERRKLPVWRAVCKIWGDSDPADWPKDSIYYQLLCDAREYALLCVNRQAIYMRDIASTWPEYSAYKDTEKSILVITSAGFVWNEVKLQKVNMGKTNIGEEMLQFPREKNTPRSECPSVPLHVVIAKAFIPNPNPEEKKYVIHLDGNRSNNNVLNLMWATRKEVLAHNQKLREQHAQ